MLPGCLEDQTQRSGSRVSKHPNFLLSLSIGGSLARRPPRRRNQGTKSRMEVEASKPADDFEAAITNEAVEMTDVLYRGFSSENYYADQTATLSQSLQPISTVQQIPHVSQNSEQQLDFSFLQYHE